MPAATHSVIETASAAQAVWLLTFLVSGVPVARYCSGTESVVLGSAEYVCASEIEIVQGELSLGAQDALWRVLFPKRTPVQYGGRFALPEIGVRVDRMILSDPSTLRTEWFGDLVSIRENARGRSELLELGIAGLKDRLARAAVGVVCTTECAWRFADPLTCGVDPTPYETVVVLKSVDGTTVIVEAQSGSIFNPGMAVLDYYRRGSLRRAGMVIGISDDLGISPSNRLTCVLDAVPPPEWVGASMTLRPGCDLRQVTCENTWNNLSRFMGLGVKMLDRNPQIEVGDE